MNYNKITGNIGEENAVNYLIQNKFTILERNYRFKRCEIDIIAKKDNCIHFIEVKIRKNNLFGYPEDFVSDNQKNRIKLAEKIIYTIIIGIIKYCLILFLLKKKIIIFFFLLMLFFKLKV